MRGLPFLAFLLLGYASLAQAQTAYDAGGPNGGHIRPGWSTTTCNSTIEGAIRYNATTKRLEFCNATEWTVAAQVQGAQPPTAPPGAGYLVLTNSTWNGNLGGKSGADAKCLTELTTNTTWLGYADANSRGLLNSSHVAAFMCDINGCNNLMPLTSYFFARVGSATNGGASFTTDVDSRGPGNSFNWSASNYFGITASYWSARGAYGCNAPTFDNVSGYSCAADTHDCNIWSASTNAYAGTTGNTSSTGVSRFTGATAGCNNTRRLVCFVNP